MKKTAKRICAVLTAVVLVAFTLAFAGCQTTLTEKEGRDLLYKSISNAAESQTYYIKYKFNDNSSENGKFVQYSLNVQGETAKFTEANGDVLKTTYDDTYYGKSLKKGVESKKAKEGDYVTGKLFWSEGDWAVTQCSLEDFISGEKISTYNMDSVVALFEGLTEDELEISEVTRTGKVTYITAKVTKEGHTLAKYKQLEIRILYDKIAFVGDKAETFSLDVFYDGPKISIPAWKYLK